MNIWKPLHLLALNRNTPYTSKLSRKPTTTPLENAKGTHTHIQSITTPLQTLFPNKQISLQDGTGKISYCLFCCYLRKWHVRNVMVCSGADGGFRWGCIEARGLVNRWECVGKWWVMGFYVCGLCLLGKRICSVNNSVFNKFVLNWKWRFIFLIKGSM